LNAALGLNGKGLAAQLYNQNPVTEEHLASAVNQTTQQWARNRKD
jgi:hypothetical protein